jgi:hypothetical protein
LPDLFEHLDDEFHPPISDHDRALICHANAERVFKLG